MPPTRLDERERRAPGGDPPSRLPAPAAPAPAIAQVLHLQASVGNAAVARAMLLREPVAGATAAKDADLDATVKLLSRATGIGAAAIRERLETTVQAGTSSAELKRLAPEVLRLGRMKTGRPLIEALLGFTDKEAETLIHLAYPLGPRYERLRSASELVMWFKSRTWWAFAGQYEHDPVVGDLLLDTLPPDELDQAYVALGQTGPDKPSWTAPEDWADRQRRVQGRVKGAMKRATQGDSERAVAERRRGKEVGEALEKRVDSVLGQARSRRKAILADIDRGVEHVDSTLGSLIEVAGTYKKARDKVEEVIKRAEAEAKLDQEKMDALLGIAIAVGVGVGLGVAIPLAHGASRGAAAVLDAVGEVYEQKTGAVVKGGGDKTPAPKAGAWERADPQLKQTEAYKKCAELYRELALLGPQIEKVGEVGDVGADLKADARELAASGSHSRFVIPDLQHMVVRLEIAAAGLKPVADQVADIRWTLHAEAEQAKREAKRADQRRMEKHIWIHWLGSRTGEEAELAGRAPVRGVLKAFGLLSEDDADSSIGWGVGDWHSDANSRTGAQKAAAYSRALSLAGQEGKLAEGQMRDIATSTPDPSAGNVSYTGRRTGFVGKVSVAGSADVYGVVVTGPAKPGDAVIVTGVVGREDRELYPGGSDTGKLGIVLSARPKPRTAAEAVGALADDTRPASAI